MSSLINRLNPKSSSLEPVAASSVRAITASEVAAALSFSQMPDISHDLIRAKYLNEHSVNKIAAIADQIMTADYPAEQHSPLLRSCIIVAVVEFCKVPADYKPSGRGRAVIIGVSEPTYRRKNLEAVIDQASHFIGQYYAIGMAKLGRQFAALRQPDDYF